MKPVAILQHMTSDGPSHLATFLRAGGVAAEVFNAEAGDAFPRTIVGHSALAVLGGEMSANDDLASLRQAEQLILEAVALDIPVLGHCLGGQLMARALGGAVRRAPQPEVGWHRIDIVDHDAARAWFGDLRSLEVFQWHYDVFELPPGALRLAGSATCPNQAFAVGPHLGMQFHVEIDAAKHAVWADDRPPDYRVAHARWPETVHSNARMRADGVVALPRQIAAAERIYRRWLGFAAR